MKNAVKLALVYVGLIIGAGFASGQELMQFFLKYGAVSIFGIMIAGSLFTLIAVLMYYKIYATSAQTLKGYFGNKAWTGILEWIVTFFMIASYIVMVAGSGAIFEEHLCLPNVLGTLAMTAICGIVFIKGAKGIVAINLALTPLMILGIVIIGAYLLLLGSVPAISVGDVVDNWCVSSLIYVSYNMITAVVVLSALQPLITSKKVAVMAGCIGGGLLAAALTILWLILYVFYDVVKDSQIPLLVAAGDAKWFYIPVLFMALVTTAISAGFGVIRNINLRLHIKPHWCIIGLCLVGILGSMGGFANLVSKLYSSFGYIGLFMMIYIVVDGIRCISARNKAK